MLVQEKTHSMHQNEAQQAVTQMPQITSPNPLHLTAVCQLTEDRIDEVANPSQDMALVGCRFRRVRFAEGSEAPKMPLVRK